MYSEYNVNVPRFTAGKKSVLPLFWRPVAPRWAMAKPSRRLGASALPARLIGSRTKLRPMHARLFDDTPHPPLLAAVGRAVCNAGVLPRKARERERDGAGNVRESGRRACDTIRETFSRRLGVV